MKPLCISILISVLFLASHSSAQTFQAGLRLNSEQMNTGPEKFIRSSPLFSSFYVTGTAFLDNDLAFEARLGYNWEDHYNGIEAGIFSKYYYKDLYAIGGVAYHHVNDKDYSDGIYRNYFTQKADLFMPALGLGFNPGRHFALELMLQHGLNQKIGYRLNKAIVFDDLYHPVSEVFPDINLKWILKFGMSYCFSF